MVIRVLKFLPKLLPVFCCLLILSAQGSTYNLRKLDSTTGPIISTTLGASNKANTSTPKGAATDTAANGTAGVTSTTVNNTPTPTYTPAPTSIPIPKIIVAFSKPGGFYDSAFNVTLSAPSGYTIYYTTDGSDPRISNNQYSEPISILKSDGRPAGQIIKSFGIGSSQFRGTVVRSYARKDNLVTPVCTQSYFVSPNLAAQYKIPYISITLKASDFAAPGGIYSTVMINPFATKERKVAFCEFFEADGTKVDELYAELSMHGNGSLGAPQKSMRLYFQNDIDADAVNYPSKLKYDIFQGRTKDVNGNYITSYKRLLLRNSGNDFNTAFLRDRLLQKISEPLIVDYQESRPAMIFIDGEFWGMYNVRERYDAKYFNDHYGITEENFAMLEAPSPLKYNMDYNHAYELCDGVAGDEKPWVALIDFAAKNNLAIEANYKKVADQLDVDNLIDMFIANIYLCNTDWPGNNVKVWRNKNANDPSGMDTKWRFVLMDMDMGGGWGDNNSSRNMMNQAFGGNVIASNLMESLLKNQGFKTKFINRFVQVVDTVYKPELTIPVLDQMANEIKLPMAFSISRWPNSGNSMSNWNSEIAKARTFLQNRSAYAKQQMFSYFGM